MSEPSLLVIGGGAMGAATAYHAAKQGATVTVIEMGGMQRGLAASSDRQRAFRFSYAANREYVAWAKAALPLWRELEQESGAELLNLCGMLFLGHGDSSYAMQSYQTLTALGEVVDLLTPAEVAARWPQFNAAALELAVLDHNGGFVAAAAAVYAMTRLAEQQGAQWIWERVINLSEMGGQVVAQTADGEEYHADVAVVAVNGWVNKLLGVNYVTNTQQPVMYFAAEAAQHSYRPADFPVFADLDSGYYGFPTTNFNAVKVANHAKGLPIDPDVRGDLSAIAVAGVRDWLTQFIPELADAALADSRICFYDNSPDDDFIIDRLPGSERIVVACGFSGHGFKFAPLVGKVLANLALSGEQVMPLDRFSIDRLAAANRLGMGERRSSQRIRFSGAAEKPMTWGRVALAQRSSGFIAPAYPASMPHGSVPPV